MFKKVWLILIALLICANAEALTPPLPTKPLCPQSGRFHPCICARAAPAGFQYQPEMDICGGNAAIILSGNLRHAFSVVVRDQENRDRWPTPFGINHCNKFQTTVQGLGKCSAYKVQKKIKVGETIVNCLGAKGSSVLLSQIIRATIKIHVNGPVYYQCLSPHNAPTTPINIPTATPTATATATSTPG